MAPCATKPQSCWAARVAASSTLRHSGAIAGFTGDGTQNPAFRSYGEDQNWIQGCARKLAGGPTMTSKTLGGAACCSRGLDPIMIRNPDR